LMPVDGIQSVNFFRNIIITILQRFVKREGNEGKWWRKWHEGNNQEKTRLWSCM